MDKLTQLYKNIIEKIKAMSRNKKIALGIILIGAVIAVVTFATYSNANKYSMLFSKLSPEDAKIITDKLKTDKVAVQVKGDAIYVPTGQVDSLRIELAPSITGGSSGYELFDSGSQFGMTDDEFKIKKLRATQGELEKTIKSFPQVENARVHLALPDATPFVTTDTQAGKVAVYIQMKPGTTLGVQQVKSIIALITGSVENVPKENVEVIDDKMNLLSQGIFDANGVVNSDSSIQNQQALQASFESKLERAVTELLVPAIGPNKVRVKVNVDMNFASTEKSVITYDPNKVIVSSHNVAQGNLGTVDKLGLGPVDNNMVNSISSTTVAAVTNTNTGTTNASTSITSLDSLYNYDVGKTETKSLSAPGEITRVTASVMVDGNLDNVTKTAIQNAVAGAIGFNAQRGDLISVVSMNFDPTLKDAAKAEIAALKAQSDSNKRMGLYGLIAIGAAIFIILLVIGIRALQRLRKKRSYKGIDVVIEDEVVPERIPNITQFEPEIDNEKNNIENDIKKYASEKPDQVADIIKSWLAEDER